MAALSLDEGMRDRSRKGRWLVRPGLARKPQPRLLAFMDGRSPLSQVALAGFAAASGRIRGSRSGVLTDRESNGFNTIIGLEGVDHRLCCLDQFADVDGTLNYALQMVVTTLSVLPVVSVFLLAQRQIIEGTARSGLKG